jgi:hypothetical protein
MEALAIDCRTARDPLVSLESREAVLSLSAGNKERRIQSAKQALRELHEMFSDRRFTSEDFIKQKAIEKAMEN